MFKLLLSIYNYTKLIYKVSSFYNLSLTKEIEEEDINTFVQTIIPNIKSCGCVCIKFSQWVTPILDILYNEIDKEPYWLKTLEKFYENCPDHSLEYTFSQYKIDFKEDFNDTYELLDIIGSGSIGQVYKIKHRLTNKYYAMKIIHPNVHYDMWFFKIIITILLRIPHTNRLIYNVLPYDISKFISLFEEQIDMINESNNLCQMSENYKDNSMIIIPTILKCSHNILVMSYEDGVDIDNSYISEYDKIKIIYLLYLFSRNNFEYKNFNHADLHKGNWKITKDNKLLIYDFGYCFKISNLNIITHISNAFIDTDKKNGIYNLKLLLIELLNIISDKDKLFIEEYIHTNLSKHINKYICDASIIIPHIFSIAKQLNILLVPEFIQAMIVEIQNNKHITKYHINNKLQGFPDGEHIYRNNYLDYYTICQTYDIFPEIQNYIKNKLNEKQVEVNELFDTLDKTSYITDDIKSLLKFD